MKNAILQRLRYFIKNNNLTIKAFGESVGVSEGTMKSMFNRETNPSVELLLKVANEYHDLSLDWLLMGNVPVGASADVAPESIQIEQNIDYKDKYFSALEELSRLKDKIISQNEEIIDLKEMILRLEKLQGDTAAGAGTVAV